MHRPIIRTTRRQLGFTLVELLVVIGIIVALIGILLPVVLHVMKAGRKSRAQADMQTIIMGLDAYKNDFGDYPRFSGPGGIGIGSNIATQWDMMNQRGAELLCRALIGPGPAFVNPSPSVGSADNSGADGAGINGEGDSTNTNSLLAGPGFRTRVGVDANGKSHAQGKVWGPYIPPDKFRIFTLSTVPNLTTAIPSTTAAGTIDATTVILDSQGHTFLYFPASLTPPNLTVSGGYVANADPTSPPTVMPLYNWFDNSLVPPDPLNNPKIKTPISLQHFQILMGDTNHDGQIESTGNPPETPTYTGPYILWSAGADGILGISPDGKSDNITNFDLPGSLRK
jgi:type II secretory pathway pseudopilin PulG